MAQTAEGRRITNKVKSPMRQTASAVSYFQAQTPHPRDVCDATQMRHLAA